MIKWNTNSRRRQTLILQSAFYYFNRQQFRICDLKKMLADDYESNPFIKQYNQRKHTIHGLTSYDRINTTLHKLSQMKYFKKIQTKDYPLFKLTKEGFNQLVCLFGNPECLVSPNECERLISEKIFKL